MPEDVVNMPPFRMVYCAVDDADGFVTEATAAGARMHRAPSDVSGTGRFAIFADPQGAGFGILQPDMSSMSAAGRARSDAGEGAYDPKKPGHVHWRELMSTDPEAGFAFYSGLFGWRKGDAMDMGDMGTSQLFNRGGDDIGGMMGLGDAPAPNWLPYSGVDDSVSTGIDAIRRAGGRVHHGPVDVPGGAWIAVAQDPQDAWFAIVGPER